MSSALRVNVPFTKAEANGNDFLVVTAERVPPAERVRFARAICDRHRGVGADGVEFITLIPGGAHLELLNADGSIAEISGNGTRCVAAVLAESGSGGELRLDTAAGEKRARVLEQGPEFWRIELAMGVPRFAMEEVPVVLPFRGKPGRPGTLTVHMREREWTLHVLSMGNPQCCLLVDAFPEDWKQLGAAWECDPIFPHRTNVEFVKVTGPQSLEIRIFERGVGPTESSGTGSCASAVTAICSGRVTSPVTVVSSGGIQEVAWAGTSGDEVWLRGPARIVARGEYEWSQA
ncbi:MAG: diaminopimelate epimerase [Terriglobales bacterium]